MDWQILIKNHLDNLANDLQQAVIQALLDSHPLPSKRVFKFEPKP